MRALLLFVSLVAVVVCPGQVKDCLCDPGKPETLQRRECSLCREAEKHPAASPVFILKDINPRKVNRWLALPRAHTVAQHSLADLTAADRAALWKAAIAKGQELFGDRWALALNGDLVRTQCHAHIHIGRLVEEVETESVITVNGPEEIPVPTDGTGMWIHAYNGKLHVHTGEQIAETVLLR